jgi:choline dehydrogenase-like flavoprotein
VSSADARTDSLVRFETDIPRTPDGDMVIQGPGAGTRLLCAAYDYDHEVAHPLMSQLPPLLYVPAGMPGDDGAVAATLRLLALELGGRPPGSRAAVGRLIDVMLIHAMRAWLRMQDDDATDGWLLALRDPVIARAMNAIHQRPREPWTIESLAREVSVSRATLARRFAHLVGGARMATDEEQGVVDAQCRTFAVPNLYITDGSVLPTQGSANPALTIMAVAARAAERLISISRRGN